MFYATNERAEVLTRHSTFRMALKHPTATHVYECYGRFEPGDKLAEARKCHHVFEERLNRWMEKYSPAEFRLRSYLFLKGWRKLEPGSKLHRLWVAYGGRP